VEECDHSAFELDALVRFNGNGREGTPQDVLRDVGCYEKRDSAAQAIALLKNLVKKQH
jgi:hypothetical protein